jgi:hypothetical protein
MHFAKGAFLVRAFLRPAWAREAVHGSTDFTLGKHAEHHPDQFFIVPQTIITLIP